MLQADDFKSIIHLLGLAALGFSLLAMSMRNILLLRIFSAIANFIYIIYGFLLGAPPLMVGGTIAVAIHAYHIRKLIHNNKVNREKL